MIEDSPGFLAAFFGYSLAVIPVNTGILYLGAMTGVAADAEILAFAGMMGSYTAGIYGMHNLPWL